MEQEKLNAICIWLIKKLCIDTNADEVKITQENFHNKKTGKVYGTYEIIIKKVSNKKWYKFWI